MSAEMKEQLEEACFSCCQKCLEIKELIESIHARVDGWSFSIERSKDGARISFDLAVLLNEKKPTENP